MLVFAKQAYNSPIHSYLLALRNRFPFWNLLFFNNNNYFVLFCRKKLCEAAVSLDGLRKTKPTGDSLNSED